MVRLGWVDKLVPELHVGGHHDVAVTLGEREDPRIGLHAKAFVSNVGGFETGGAKGLRQSSWEILVDEEPSHLPDRSHLLGREHLRRVPERGKNVLPRDAVLACHLFDGQACGHLADDDFDRYPRPLDDGTARPDRRIRDDARSQNGDGHGNRIAPTRPRSP
jgi:hypothetical protein